ncbi:MAG TPA: CpaF family protein [Methylomirabilota bacterium]|nr:CpaF family protein [Methylomirabilota bacterium]
MGLPHSLRPRASTRAAESVAAAAPATATPVQSRPDATETKTLVHSEVLLRIDAAATAALSRAELAERVEQIVAEIGKERRLLLNQQEQHEIAVEITDDMVGLGPLEPLLRDPGVADILVNGANQVYIERKGKLELTGVRFRNDAHVLHVAQRIASAVGRRVDESSPMLDARLQDGSRVNVIIRPLSLRGPCISIRKFSRKFVDLAELMRLSGATASLTRALEIAARCRLNIIISGGTGSGKTTLLNAMSRLIDPAERVITIEDAAELQLQQPHVIPLETRPPNIEGEGRVIQGDLLRNALRMRPDRIIIGEVRGGEAFDMLQAMNTGHNGSMSTIHANTPTDALARIENMVIMGGVQLPSRAIRRQIASAVDLVIQIERMRDGVRRIVQVAEVVGVEEEAIVLAPLFTYVYLGENLDGTLRGEYVASAHRPRFLARLDYYGLGAPFVAALGAPRLDG